MTINKKRFNIYTICMIALLTAMMVLLKRTIAIEPPYFKCSFASLPIVLGARVFGTCLSWRGCPKSRSWTFGTTTLRTCPLWPSLLARLRKCKRLGMLNLSNTGLGGHLRPGVLPSQDPGSV